MEPFPTDEQLQEMYGHLVEDQDIRDLSCWSEANQDGPCDEETYVENARQNAEAMENLYTKALEGIKSI